MKRPVLYRCSITRSFNRYKSHYLSDKWIKEPFDIGYPVISSQTQKDRDELINKLFPKSILTGYDYFAQDPNRTVDLEEWDSLDVDEVNKYKKLAIEKSPHYIHPKPEPVKSIELFKLQTQIKTPNYILKLWSQLNDEVKNRFSNGPNIDIIHKERLRIWKGYEIVEYLKRYSSKYMWNPYPLSTLYPWEIIKDKLRNRRNFQAFEFDYYDTLIKEAFFRNSQRKAVHIFYTDLAHNSPGKYSHQQVQRLFHELSPEKKDYYMEKERKRQIHAQKTKINIADPGFYQFLSELQQSSTSPEGVSIFAANKWKNLSGTEKKKYQLTLSSRQRREIVLDWKVSVVMDYIYHTGGVVDLDYDYNWREDMREKTKGFEYLNKVYTDKVI